jgi:hypothetical protein
MIKDIALFILSHSGLPWTLDEDFFVGHLPARNKNGDLVENMKRVMVILERVPGAVIGDLPDRCDKAIQVWNRAGSYFVAAEDAEQIFAILHGATGWDMVPPVGSAPEYYAMTIDAVASPAPIAAPNEKGLFEFSTNYVFRIEGNPAVP